jgi:hypothetical protein
MMNRIVKLYTMATETLIRCTPKISSKIICLKYSVFVLRKFIVLFNLHYLFYMVQLTIDLFVCHML